MYFRSGVIRRAPEDIGICSLHPENHVVAVEIVSISLTVETLFLLLPVSAAIFNSTVMLDPFLKSRRRFDTVFKSHYL